MSAQQPPPYAAPCLKSAAPVSIQAEAQCLHHSQLPAPQLTADTPGGLASQENNLPMCHCATGLWQSSRSVTPCRVLSSKSSVTMCSGEWLATSSASPVTRYTFLYCPSGHQQKVDTTFQGGTFSMELTLGEIRGFLCPTPTCLGPSIQFLNKTLVRKEHLFSQLCGK